MTKHDVAAGLLAAAIGLGACGGDASLGVGAGAGGDPASAAARADTLWANRTADTGDNSKVIGLVRAAGFGPVGSCTISLATSSRPYRLTVTLDHPAKPTDTTDLTTPATVPLGTIRNLDEVHVVDSPDEWSLTTAQATRLSRP